MNFRPERRLSGKHNDPVRVPKGEKFLSSGKWVSATASVWEPCDYSKAMDGNAHHVQVEWPHPRRASLREEEEATFAALEALVAGMPAKEAANLLISKMFAKRHCLFGLVRVIIDGEVFD